MATVSLLVISARLSGFVGAALSFALMVWWGQDLLRYAIFGDDATWAEVGVVPLVIVLRIAIAAWVAWSVARLAGGRELLRALLAGFGVSFFLLYGWYFLLTGMDWGFLYWVVAGDFFYLAGALAAGCALLLTRTGARSGSART